MYDSIHFPYDFIKFPYDFLHFLMILRFFGAGPKWAEGGVDHRRVPKPTCDREVTLADSFAGGA